MKQVESVLQLQLLKEMKKWALSEVGKYDYMSNFPIRVFSQVKLGNRYIIIQNHRINIPKELFRKWKRKIDILYR